MAKAEVTSQRPLTIRSGFRPTACFGQKHIGPGPGPCDQRKANYGRGESAHDVDQGAGAEPTGKPSLFPDNGPG